MTDWSQIVERHGPAVWRMAVRLLSNEADAADCFSTHVCFGPRGFAQGSSAELAGSVETIRDRAGPLSVYGNDGQDTDRLTALPREAADSKAIDPAEAAIAGELADRTA